MPRKGYYFPGGKIFYQNYKIKINRSRRMCICCFSDSWYSLFHCIGLKRKYDASKAEFRQSSRNQRNSMIQSWKRQIRKNLNEDFILKCPDYDATCLSDLEKIEKIFRCRIYLWGQRTIRTKFECLRHSPYMPKSAYDNYVDVILTNVSIELSFENAGVIFDIDDTTGLPEDVRIKRQTWTLFEAVAIQKQPRLETKVTALREKVSLLETEWGKSEFHIADSREFRQKFQLTVQIWNIIEQFEGRSVMREKVFDTLGMPKLIGQFSKK